jgi:hypothetical protein
MADNILDNKVNYMCQARELVLLGAPSNAFVL